eukprot:TRINITY_DN72006_c0_g1_i1.p1 TRINITY_DN72006_c0_g1~~TRINITY_DN72006_c0_g1_i1.p1  ORF type:complete len:208 (-),score=7.02 TRINITY_DN72006_c0_g1_i1:160-726(-)
MTSSTCCCGACNLRTGVYVIAILQLVAAFYSFIILAPVGLPGSHYPSIVNALSGIFYFLLGVCGLWATQKVIYEERNTAEQARRVGIYWWLFLMSFLILGILFPIINAAVAYNNVNSGNIPGLDKDAANFESERDQVKNLLTATVVLNWVVIFPLYCYLVLVVWSFRKQIREGTYQEVVFAGSSAATI